MATETLSDTGQELVLKLNNGDYARFKEAVDKWNFKDNQSLIRFILAILVLSEDKIISTRMDGLQKEVIPSKDFTKLNKD
jgi:hypothetical protein